jgi:adenine phosphoribosyltransferase
MAHRIKLIDVKEAIRNIPDFPIKGIQFKDLTTAFKRPEIFEFLVNKIHTYYEEKGITKVIGVESRGFILGGALAASLNAGFVPVRKPGKLPADKYSITYALEYGTDTLEIHKDALSPNDIVLLHDDLLATGGTTKAVLELLKKFQVKETLINYIVELDFLKGREKIGTDYDIYSLVHF